MRKRKFWYGFLYFVKTGKNAWGYILNKREYHHALERYRESQRIRTEIAESGIDKL
jgi:hypothetical protein